MIPFTETMRHDHPIAKDDWVLEIGAHKGYDTEIFAKKYGCQVVAFEPVKEFFDELIHRFVQFPVAGVAGLVTPVHAGAAATTRREMFGVQGDRSGVACSGNHKESVNLMSIVTELNKWTNEFRKRPALLQINAEGGEYEILEALANAGLLSTLPRIQVQFHSVLPECRVRRAMIYDRLDRAHNMLWEPGEFDTGWVGWVRR